MNEKTVKNRNYFYIVVLGVLLFAIYNLFGAGIHDNGAGVDNVRGGIEQSAESNTKLQEQLRGAESTADEIAGSINAGTSAIADAERTTSTITNDIETAADAIAKCQSIVNGIKQRNEGTKTKP